MGIGAEAMGAMDGGNFKSVTSGICRMQPSTILNRKKPGNQ
jgi:hypothetical protein